MTRTIGSLLLLAALAVDAQAASAEWDFRALLDGKPIGQHRFGLSDNGHGERKLLSEAEFTVKILGIPAYSYRHRAVEHWQGDCLRAIESTTDDDGKQSRVQLDRGDGVLGNGCLMSFAYWNPALLSQTRLLNAQTGRVENVTVQPPVAGTLEVRGAPVQALRYRIAGAAQPVDVWLTPNGDWVGLDAIVAGGRRLSYRLP